MFLVSEPGSNILTSSRIETHRSIVDQCHLHHSLELAVLDTVFFITGFHFLDQVVVEATCVLGQGGSMKIGLSSLLRPRQQCELRD